MLKKCLQHTIKHPQMNRIDKDNVITSVVRLLMYIRRLCIFMVCVAICVLTFPEFYAVRQVNTCGFCYHPASRGLTDS